MIAIEDRPVDEKKETQDNSAEVFNSGENMLDALESLDEITVDWRESIAERKRVEAMKVQTLAEQRVNRNRRKYLRTIAAKRTKAILRAEAKATVPQYRKPLRLRKQKKSKP